MHQRIIIVISCLSGVLAIATIVTTLLFAGRDKAHADEPASSYDQLKLSISFKEAECEVRIWKADTGCYYFFLPSGVENNDIYFFNLSHNSTLQLNSSVFSSSDSITDSISFSVFYEMQLTLSSDTQPLEAVPVVFLQSDGIPSLFIDTATGSMEAIHADKQTKEAASIRMFREDGSREYSGELKYIKGRGNSSFFISEKKSYQIRLDRNVPLLDMPEAEKWILLPSSYDDSLIKNAMVFQYAQEYTTIPVPRGRFVDLYLNGNYVGNYFFCEKIEINENRLNLTDLEELTEQVNFERNYENAELYVSDDGKIRATKGLDNPSDITGGYLLEHIPQSSYEVAENAFMTESGHCYEIVSPNPATVEQAQYICNLFNEMEMAITQENGVNPETGKHFSEYLDIDSWTSKYLIEEAFSDIDAGEHSMFFYKDADSVDPLIYSGPMWDYDKAIGSGSIFYFLHDANYLGYYGIYARELMQHELVSEQVHRKFIQDWVPYVEYLAGTDIYHLSELIKASAEMNRIRWPQIQGFYSDDEAGREYLLHFLQKKTELLYEYWLEGEEYCTVTFLDYSGNVYERYNIKKGDYLSDVPVIAAYGAVFAGWYTVDGNIAFDSRLPILQDVTYASSWIDVDVILQNGIVISDMDISQVDVETLQTIIDQIKKLQEAIEK